MEGVVEHVRDEYPEGTRLVEVGVGRRDAVAYELSELGYEVTATDLRDVSDDVRDGVGFVIDDVRSPSADVYGGAGLVYSIRPPYEIHDALAEVARGAGADLLVAPLREETPSFDAELVNSRGRALFVRRI